MGMVAPRFWTADQVRSLPEDGTRQELVHGKLLVTPAPSAWHAEISLRLLEEIRAWLRRTGVGHAFGSRSDLSWGSEEFLVSPDLIVVPLEEARRLDWTALRTVLLVVEVLSPSSLRLDGTVKRRLYQERGVGHYWIVDPEEQVVEIWRPGDAIPHIEHDEITWQPTGAASPFSLRLVELFRPL